MYIMTPVCSSMNLNDTIRRSWIFDHVAEIVHLVTQIQMTEQIEETLNDMDGGNKEALQV